MRVRRQRQGKPMRSLRKPTVKAQARVEVWRWFSAGKEVVEELVGGTSLGAHRHRRRVPATGC
jgi:hypothetical protein